MTRKYLANETFRSVGACRRAAPKWMQARHYGDLPRQRKGHDCWLQLVKTPDNHLSGQLAEYVIGPDGRILQDTAPITGAVDGVNVTISVSKLLGLANTTLGGTIDGDQLNLSGAQATSIAW